MRFRFSVAPSLLALLLASGCAATQAPIKPVPQLELPRYMGRWYVIASIPSYFERDGYNPVETYCLTPESKIDTSFRFHRGSFTAPARQIHSTATVVAGTGNAVWSVHLFGFLHAQYIVAWLSPGYDQVIVARDKRDYLWIMARTPQIADADYQRLTQRAQTLGYDLARLRKAPQQWPAADQSRHGENVCR